jgi:hypothetical protein
MIEWILSPKLSVKNAQFGQHAGSSFDCGIAASIAATYTHRRGYAALERTTGKRISTPCFKTIALRELEKVKRGANPDSRSWKL